MGSQNIFSEKRRKEWGRKKVKIKIKKQLRLSRNGAVFKTLYLVRYRCSIVDTSARVALLVGFR